MDAIGVREKEVLSQMRIYTGTGDVGKTSLFSGERVTKSNPAVEAYGGLDELNAIIGALICALPETEETLTGDLLKVQANLFRAGAWLATSPDSPVTADLEQITPDHILHLEGAIDKMEETLPTLSGFILPGGHATACWAHIARTVCRRVERKIVGLFADNAQAQIPAPMQHLMVYVNRLSDYLFVLARFCNRISGVADIPWRK
jgi:cob(I)alamin adenosyltransferase